MGVNILDIMLPAFAECLVLVGIHSYLGLHVIKRKVIFVDLALAQIAALGTTVAFLFKIDPGSQGAYWFSLGFTLIGAAIFSVSRIRNEKIPQEAVIGLVYALAAALAILVVDRAPHGAEHIKEIMTGSILWVRWDTIITAAIVYSLVGVFHFVFRDKFLLISNHPEVAYQKGINVRLWDFLFYASFGLVITHSVRTAGVLLVFVFLVVPAIATIMLTDKLWLQLVIGWTMGTIVSVLGLYVSYVADLPSGPTVVSTYGLVLLVLALVLYVVRAPQKSVAWRNLATGIAIFLVTVGGFYAMGKTFQHREHHHIAPSDASRQQLPHPEDQFLQMSDAELQQRLAQDNSPASLEKLYTQIKNPFQQFEVAQKLLKADPKSGSKVLIDFLESCQIPFLRQKALDLLVPLAGQNFGYDAMKTQEENHLALKFWREWWKRKYGRG